MIPSGQVIGAPNLQPTIGGGRDVYRPTSAPRRAGITEIDLRGIAALAGNQKAREEQQFQDEVLPGVVAAVIGEGSELTDAVGPGSTTEGTDKALRSTLEKYGISPMGDPRKLAAAQRVTGSLILVNDFWGALQKDLAAGAIFYDETGRVKENFDPEAWFKSKWDQYKNAPIFKFPGGAQAVQSAMPEIGAKAISAAGQAWGEARSAQATQDFAGSVKSFFTGMAEADPDENVMAIFQMNVKAAHALGIPNVRRGVIQSVEMAAREMARGRTDPDNPAAPDPEGAEAIIVRAFEHIQIGPERLADNAEALRILEPLLAKFKRQAEDLERQDEVKERSVQLDIRNLLYVGFNGEDPASAEESVREYIATSVPPSRQGIAYETLEKTILSRRDDQARTESHEGHDVYKYHRQMAMNGDGSLEDLDQDRAKMSSAQYNEIEKLYLDRHAFRDVLKDQQIDNARVRIDQMIASLPEAALARERGLETFWREILNTEILRFAQGLDRAGIRVDTPEGALKINEFTQDQIARFDSRRDTLEQNYQTQRDTLVNEIITASAALNPGLAETKYEEGLKLGVFTPKTRLELFERVQDAHELHNSYLTREGAVIAGYTRDHLQNMMAVQSVLIADENAFAMPGSTTAQKVKDLANRSAIEIEEELIQVSRDFITNVAPTIPPTQVRTQLGQALSNHVKKLDLELVGLDYESVTELVSSGTAPSFRAAMDMVREDQALAVNEERIADAPAPAKDIIRRAGYPLNESNQVVIPARFHNSAVTQALGMYGGTTSKSSARSSLASSAGRVKDLSHEGLEIDPKAQQAMWSYAAGWAGMLSVDDLMEGVIHLGDPKDRPKMVKDAEIAKLRAESSQTHARAYLNKAHQRTTERLKAATLDASTVLPMLSLYEMPLSFSPTRGEPSETDLDAWLAKTSEEEIGLFLSAVTGDSDPNVSDWVKAQRTAIRNYQALR